MERRNKRALATIAVAAALTLALAPGGLAQKKKKGNGKADAEPTFALPDPQHLEKMTGEMLAAWQIGDVALLQKYYAPDVTIVSGNYEPPLQGWASYAPAYQRQRQRLQAVRIERRNTFIQVKGTVAWAIYQWEMFAEADGAPFGARGHTTLTFEKRGGNWLIVHNHTSMVETAQPRAAQPQAAQTPPPSGTP
jgi:ketosteroid isomerase-like protein